FLFRNDLLSVTADDNFKACWKGGAMQALQSPPGTFSSLEATVGRVKDASSRFARLNLVEGVHLLRSMREGYFSIAEESVLAACRAKGIDPRSSIAGEEWLSGPLIVIRNLRLLEEALQDVQREGIPRISKSQLRTLPDGRLAVKVFPSGAL